MTTPNTGDTVTIDYVLKRTDGQEVGNTAQVGPQEMQLETSKPSRSRATRHLVHAAMK